MVGAEDERHGVEQEDGRLGLVGHGTSLSGDREQWSGSAPDDMMFFVAKHHDGSSRCSTSFTS
jgi:hypothetical protein